MPEYIAHASIDENGKIAGGKAGDQTAKEVCIRTWYNKNWGYVLRIMNEDVRIQFANNMIDLANNDNVGYDQNQRNTLLTQAESVEFDFSKISLACECDCSSAVTVAILGAIYKILGRAVYEKALSIMFSGNNCATTRTLRSRLAKLDMISVKEYTSNTYTSKTSYAEYGDIYLKEGNHVVCYIADGKKKEDETRETNEKKKNVVLEWQEAAIADGFSFPKYGANGEWGTECETVAKKAVVKKQLVGYKYPNLTRIVQRKVGLTGSDIDGKCGKKTREAIITYQVKSKLYADGCVGINTWKKILEV